MVLLESAVFDIGRFRQGDSSAFKTVFDSLYHALCLFTNRFLDDLAASEDIVQEAFCTLWKHREEMESVVHVKSFLYSVVRNSALDYIKHQEIKLRYEQSLHDLEDKTSFEYFIIEEEVERILLKTRESLPPKCKEIFVLAMQGKDNQEIARILNISVNTVKTQKKITYKRLKNYIYEISSLLLLLHK